MVVEVVASDAVVVEKNKFSAINLDDDDDVEVDVLGCGIVKA